MVCPKSGLVTQIRFEWSLYFSGLDPAMTAAFEIMINKTCLCEYYSEPKSNNSWRKWRVFSLDSCIILASTILRHKSKQLYPKSSSQKYSHFWLSAKKKKEKKERNLVGELLTLLKLEQEKDEIANDFYFYFASDSNKKISTLLEISIHKISQGNYTIIHLYKYVYCIACR